MSERFEGGIWLKLSVHHAWDPMGYNNKKVTCAGHSYFNASECLNMKLVGETERSDTTLTGQRQTTFVDVNMNGVFTLMHLHRSFLHP